MMKEIIRISMFLFSWLQYNVLNTNVSNRRKYLVRKKETGNYSGSFRMYSYDTLLVASLVYSFVV